MNRLSKSIHYLGPGIIAASAAVGTSHLVQSTRAGTYFGFELLWLIVLINLIKYLFIENGYRYTGATGKNLIDAYYQLNPYYLWIFLMINIISALGGIAVLIYVSAGIAKAVLGLTYSINQVGFVIMLITTLLVVFETYDFLDHLMKVFMVFLFLSTCFVVISAVLNFKPNYDQVIYHTSAWNVQSLPFVIALMGWMPGPMELGTWYSLWLEEKNKGQYKLDYKAAKKDFNFGYILVIIIAVFFNVMGAMVLHYSGQTISSNAAEFSHQLITIYTGIMGGWSYAFIGIAILTTILSSTFALIDVYPRSIVVSLAIMRNQLDEDRQRRQRQVLTVICAVMAYLINYFFVTDFRTILDIVSTIAFIFAPFIAFLNYRVVNSHLLDQAYHPGKVFRCLCWIAIVFFIVFDMVFIYSKYI